MTADRAQQVAEVADRVRASAPRLGRTRLVVVDGPAGSGKTTFAGRLGAVIDAPVLHADDFLAGWGDLEGWWTRLDEWVLRPLADGRPGRYRRYDWLAAGFGEWHDLPVPDVLVVEGCGSARRAADAVAVLRVWVEAPDDVRLARGLERDGEELREEWLAWMAAERAHYAAESTRERADVLVDGCGEHGAVTVHRPDPGLAGAHALFPPGAVPPREWYARDAHDVAADLLGAHVTTRRSDGDVTLRLTEVEVYRGEVDPASHAFRGRTARNAAMFGEPGRLYVYRHLGLHHCVNVVTGADGFASAVLLRAGEVVDGAHVATTRRRSSGVVRTEVDLARGPARLAVALGLDLTAYGADLTDPDGDVVVHRDPSAPVPAHLTGPRVGVSGVGADPDRYPWRLWLAGEPTVSVYRPAAPPRRRAPRTA